MRKKSNIIKCLLALPQYKDILKIVKEGNALTNTRSTKKTRQWLTNSLTIPQKAWTTKKAPRMRDEQSTREGGLSTAPSFIHIIT